MADFPAAGDYNLNTINPAHRASIGLAEIGMAQSNTGTSIWDSANLAFFVPFRVANPITIVKIFWQNGASVGTNNVDVGIYGQDGSRIVSSGSILTSGASAIQAADITDTTLTPGLYYMAMAVDGTTNTFSRFPPQSASQAAATGVYQMASAFPLPSSATFASLTTQRVPNFTLTTKTTI